jgi:hypothetical protein
MAMPVLTLLDHRGTPSDLEPTFGSDGDDACRSLLGGITLFRGVLGVLVGV